MLFSSFTLLPFDQAAAERFAAIRLLPIGTMDKKIAAIALATGSLLLTANRRDFCQVPGLRIEDWAA